MRAWITRICAGLLIAATAGTAGWYTGAQEKEEPVRTLKVNEVARVAERVITAEELIERIVERERLYAADPDMRTVAWALDSLLLEELLQLESDRLEAWPKQREVQDEAETIRKHHMRLYELDNDGIKASGREPYKDFEEWLMAKFDFTLAEFDTYITSLSKRMLTLRLVVNYWRISTKSAEVEGVFCRTRDKIDKARARLLKGEAIAIVAEQMSDDLHSREGGGYLGSAFPNDGSLKPQVEKVLWEIEKGKISEVIAVDNGFWVIRKKHEQLANEAPFFDQRQKCLEGKDPDSRLLMKWLSSMQAEGRYAFERRMPGVDVKAGEK